LVGLYYAHAHGVAADERKAAAFYERASDAGNADAQSNLGYCFKVGKGVDANARTAVVWFIRAASAGNSGAQCNRVMADAREAVVGNTRAAEAGRAVHPRALLLLRLWCDIKQE